MLLGGHQRIRQLLSLLPLIGQDPPGRSSSSGMKKRRPVAETAELNARILLLVTQDPNREQKSIVEELGISPNIVLLYLKKLEHEGKGVEGEGSKNNIGEDGGEAAPCMNPAR